jgi:hypothetical protein
MTDGHTKRGKWSQPGVPHIAWSCVGVEDLQEAPELCAMCESTQIRYVHVMEHPDYPKTLGVGCVCAEHMEQDYVRPRLREQNLRSKSQRRKTWIRRNWRTSAKGNLYLNTEGYNLTVFEISGAMPQRWGLRVTNRESQRTQLGRRRYDSEEAAKRAALDALIWAKDHLAD